MMLWTVYEIKDKVFASNGLILPWVGYALLTTNICDQSAENRLRSRRSH